MITITSEIDTLERFIYFTKHTEYIDHDVSLFFSEQILDQHADFCRRLRGPGKYFKMTERLNT